MSTSSPACNKGFHVLALHLHMRATAPARRQPLRLGAGRARRTASPWRDTSTTPASAPGRAAHSATRQQNVRSRSECFSFCCSPASTSPCAPHSLACCGMAEAGAALTTTGSARECTTLECAAKAPGSKQAATIRSAPPSTPLPWGPAITARAPAGTSEQHTRHSSSSDLPCPAPGCVAPALCSEQARLECVVNQGV